MSERLSNDIAAWVIQHEGMPKQALATGIKALIDRATPTPDVAGLITEAQIYLTDVTRQPHVSALIGRLIAALETQSRERAALAELLRKCEMSADSIVKTIEAEYERTWEQTIGAVSKAQVGSIVRAVLNEAGYCATPLPRGVAGLDMAIVELLIRARRDIVMAGIAQRQGHTAHDLSVLAAELCNTVESLSRERALRSSAMLSVKLELHKFCIGDTVLWEQLPETTRTRIDALIEGEKEQDSNG